MEIKEPWVGLNESENGGVPVVFEKVKSPVTVPPPNGSVIPPQPESRRETPRMDGSRMALLNIDSMISDLGTEMPIPYSVLIPDEI